VRPLSPRRRRAALRLLSRRASTDERSRTAHRSLILDELNKLLPGQVDSFGSCLNNAKAADTLQELGLADEVGTKTRWNEKVRSAARSDV